MSGPQERTSRSFSDRVRDAGARVQLSPFDRLLDDAPELDRDRPLSPSEAMSVLKRAVRRDLEALLNAKRGWRSLPGLFPALVNSNAGYGLPDYTAGSMADADARERFRQEIERTIRVFEPRFARIAVRLLDADARLDSTLRLKIEGLLHADPAPEPISFDTIIDAATAEVAVKDDPFV